jgi:DNA-binding MarR family transcriptional regulator
MAFAVEAIRRAEAITNRRFITTECEIISLLHSNGPMSVQRLMRDVRISPSGFQLSKRCLQDIGLIVTQRSVDDGRVTLLDLSPELRRELDLIDA